MKSSWSILCQKMNIESFRQTMHGRTNRRRLAFLELLSEPKGYLKSFILKIFLAFNKGKVKVKLLYYLNVVF